MAINFYKDDQRVIRVEPNPFKTLKQKIKMRTRKTSGGRPIVSQDGRAVYTDEAPQNMTRIPGTSKKLVPPRTAAGLLTGLDVVVPNPYNDEKIYRVDWAEIGRAHV